MKVMTIFGTRPEGIKMAPVIQALNRDPFIESVALNTGQHKEMLDQVLELFQLVPDYNLHIMKNGQTVEELTSRLIQTVTPIIQKEAPDLVLVHGDTTTTLVGAYTAFLQKIPVGHVEAGLRTDNKYSPFPEEINRQLVDRLASYHFAATPSNKQNLIDEKINADHIIVTGNTVIDALLQITEQPHLFPAALKKIFKSEKKTILLTTHRRENLKDLQYVYRAINRIVKENKDVQVVFPVHKNPKIRATVRAEIGENENIHLIEPLDYQDFVHVMKQSYLVITDSGGIQEEAPGLGKPVLVARNTTERPEGVEAGTLKLVGTSEEKIYTECTRLLVNETAYKSMAAISNPFGNGEAAAHIVSCIKNNIFENISEGMLEETLERI
ncbi:non-hydrolyzing UDP-N-acetylglucosamine 2-epimerase [Alkalicoccus daliensis]|uniref:UDP-N-acetylglucosamine 2-epimerase (non-hydrolyzing) n=1 Tax=Alkalicoccus daliensis TaxID=745820 RepID=A0A1H0HX17_9BACI|nr:UDP-N-acetylglucosamine 2-epimerase (non-hydrolyzing) [Alkalicoccus daliensis]SDO23697.1 UDP-N-acetylglucosamine 2-epimerase (non-hydrolysing) [Alkalicoccus daliensis]